MPTKTFAGTTVDVNDEGFFQDPTQWTKEMAPEIAGRVRRADAADRSRTGSSSTSCARSTSTRAPDRPFARSANCPTSTTKELFVLFPKGPAKLAAMVAGIPKPKGCI